MQIIEELELTRRGVYGGAVLYADFAGNLDSCIVIRTLLMKGKKAYLQAGAGIVADSDPQREFEEAENKSRAMLRAVEMARGRLIVMQLIVNIGSGSNLNHSPRSGPSLASAFSVCLNGVPRFGAPNGRANDVLTRKRGKDDVIHKVHLYSFSSGDGIGSRPLRLGTDLHCALLIHRCGGWSFSCGIDPDSAGNLYGTTIGAEQGGLEGSVYKLNPKDKFKAALQL